MALMTYFTRDKHGTYYFRRPIPARLRAFMPAPWSGKTAFKQSLRTKRPAEARSRAARLYDESERAFGQAEAARSGRGGTSSQAKPSLIVDLAVTEQEFYRRLLADDQTEREEGDVRRHLQTTDERAQWPDLVPVAFGAKGMASDHFDLYGDQLEEFFGEYKAALARSDPGIVDAELRAYLRENQLSLTTGSEDYYRAGLAILKAHVRAYGELLRRQAGEIVETPEPPVSKGPVLSEAFEEWSSGSAARGARKPSANTIAEARYALKRFIEWHGDLPLASISRAKVREFRDALARVPTRLPSGLRSLPLPDLLQRDLTGFPPASVQTINKAIQLLSAITNHAYKEGLLDELDRFANPFQGMKLVADARHEEERRAFKSSDLARLFGSPIYASGERPRGGGGEAAYWLPLIALFSGARLSELAQLRLCDLAQDEDSGVWYIDIGSTGRRSIKTATSRRLLPVHDALRDLGLLAYRQSLVDSGAELESPLWPDLAGERRGGSAAWSKWFNRYLRSPVGIDDKSIVFHSFRHTFKRMARDARITEEQHDALTGHSGAGVGRSYGAGFGLKALSRAINQIERPLVVSALIG